MEFVIPAEAFMAVQKATEDSSPEAVKAREEAERAESAKRYAAAEEERLRAFIKANSHLSAKVKQAVMERSVVIGMPEEALVASWGPPEKKNRSVYASGTREQWIYPGYPQKRYVYLVIRT